MSAPSIETAQSWQGRTMVDPAGDKLGTIDAIYLDDETGQPEWATVTSGLFTAKITLVPLAQAQDIGDSVQVPYDKDQIKGAPSMEPDGQLSQDEEAELYRHYGLDYSEHRSDSGLPAGERGRDHDDGDDDQVPDGAVGRDTSGPTTDDAMTRSEEELHVGTQTRERGRARLRKYVTTEQQTVTVPVQREEVRVEREPITDANLDAATSGPQSPRRSTRSPCARRRSWSTSGPCPRSGSAWTPRRSPKSARSPRRSARSRSRSTATSPPTATTASDPVSREGSRRPAVAHGGSLPLTVGSRNGENSHGRHHHG